MPDLPPDAELVARIRDDNEEAAHIAFSALFNAYWVILCKWAYYFTRDHAAAEEIVADVLGNLWHRRAAWAPQGSVEAYLFGAVRMQMRFRARGLARQDANTHRLADADGDVPGMGTHHLPSDVGAHAADLRARLDRAMATLSGRARAALMYRFYEGLDHREIALRLGTTEQAVRLLTSRSIRGLRTLLAGEDREAE